MLWISLRLTLIGCYFFFRWCALFFLFRCDVSAFDAASTHHPTVYIAIITLTWARRRVEIATLLPTTSRLMEWNEASWSVREIVTCAFCAVIGCASARFISLSSMANLRIVGAAQVGASRSPPQLGAMVYACHASLGQRTTDDQQLIVLLPRTYQWWSGGSLSPAPRGHFSSDGIWVWVDDDNYYNEFECTQLDTRLRPCVIVDRSQLIKS